MGQNTEGLSTTPADIEATRSDLSRDIDELADKVSPARVVDRRKQAAKGRLDSVRTKVMGAMPSGGSGHSSSGAGLSGAASNATGSVSNAAGSVSDAASGAVGTIGSKAQGNPLAAGVVAFGAGMLLSALLPASQKEAELAQRTVEAAKEHGQPLVDHAKSVGSDMASDLKDSASDSAEQVKASAQDSAQTVKQEGQSSAQTVKEDAKPNG
jgi:gas vesicle protein